MSDADVEASPIKKKRVMKDVKKTAKRPLEKSTNSIDKEVNNNEFETALCQLIIFCKRIVIPFFVEKQQETK